jgi:ABC-type antimicrobial peptide transport system permease subunit
MMYLIEQYWWLLLIALLAGIVCGWMTSKKSAR